MAIIQILGTGCTKCGYLAANAHKAVHDSGRDDVIEKVTDIVKILDFSPMALPALAINGRVVTAGTLPSPNCSKYWLRSKTCRTSFRIVPGVRAFVTTGISGIPSRIIFRNTPEPNSRMASVSHAWRKP